MEFRIGSTHGRMQTGAVRAARRGLDGGVGRAIVASRCFFGRGDRLSLAAVCNAVLVLMSM